MNTINNTLTPASRAMLVGAMIGGAASIARQLKQHKTLAHSDTNMIIANVAKDTLKAGAISGATTYAADKMAGQPILSILTIVAASSAGLYMLDQHME